MSRTPRYLSLDNSQNVHFLTKPHAVLWKPHAVFWKDTGQFQNTKSETWMSLLIVQRWWVWQSTVLPHCEMHCSMSPTYMGASYMYIWGSFHYLNSSGTSTSPVNSTGQAHFISSSSLALQPWKFGLGFPHDRYPFYSVHTSCPPSSHTHIPQVQFSIFHSLQSRSSFFSLSSWFPFQ